MANVYGRNKRVNQWLSTIGQQSLTTGMYDDKVISALSAADLEEEYKNEQALKDIAIRNRSVNAQERSIANNYDIAQSELGIKEDALKQQKLQGLGTGVALLGYGAKEGYLDKPLSYLEKGYDWITGKTPAVTPAITPAETAVSYEPAASFVSGTANVPYSGGALYGDAAVAMEEGYMAGPYGAETAGTGAFSGMAAPFGAGGIMASFFGSKTGETIGSALGVGGKNERDAFGKIGVGAATGAAYGAIVGGPPGALIGGLCGAVAGAVSAVIGIVSGGSIICTELYNQKEITRTELVKCKLFYERYIDNETYIGYLIMFTPIVEKMQKHGLFNTLFKPFAKAFVKECVHRVDDKKDSSLLGSILIDGLSPICRLIYRRYFGIQRPVLNVGVK